MAHILIVEDDYDIRDALASVLELEGHDVRTASNGIEGLAEARNQRPDIILLDLMMPVMNGWQFRAEQKRDADLADVPVVVVSASGSGTVIDAAGFVPKPCEVDVVLEAVRRYATNRRAFERADRVT